jgi:hypothetical protein
LLITVFSLLVDGGQLITVWMRGKAFLGVTMSETVTNVAPAAVWPAARMAALAVLAVEADEPSCLGGDYRALIDRDIC